MPHPSFRIALVALSFVSLATAQSAPSASKAGASTEDPVQLSPFEVTADVKGYFSGNTMSGTRLNSKLEDLGSSINNTAQSFVAP